MSNALTKREVAVVPAPQPAAMSPVYLGSIAVPAHEMLDLARKIAITLADIIERQRLFKQIGPKKHVYVEGWTTLGALIGVVPCEVSSTNLEPGVYEGTVELRRTFDQAVVGRASAVCSKEEANWKTRDKYAIKSMATTRATGKAFRLGYSWIMVLAGYEATPAEEMPHGWGDSGSREAQAEARDAKLAELRENAPQGDSSDGPALDIREDELPPSVSPTASYPHKGPIVRSGSKPKTLNYDFLQRMKVKGTQLGRECYEQVLGNLGYEHSNEITKPEAQEEAIKAMQQAVRDYLREMELGGGGKLYDKMAELFEDPEVAIAKANILYHSGKQVNKGPAQVDAEVLLALESGMTHADCLKEYKDQIKAKGQPQ